MSRVLKPAIAMGLLGFIAALGCGGGMPGAVERGDEDGERRVLIAVEPSEFKDGVATRVLDDLGSSGYYVKLIELDWINEEKSERYHAIVLLNALQMMRLDGAVRDFFDSLDDATCKRVILVTTTTHEDWSFFHEDPVWRGVDAITAASKLANVEPVSEEVINRVEGLAAEE